jgi:hypothetical protein
MAEMLYDRLKYIDETNDEAYADKSMMKKIKKDKNLLPHYDALELLLKTRTAKEEKKKEKEETKKEEKPESEYKKDIYCAYCHNIGHTLKDCRKRKQAASNPYQNPYPPQLQPQPQQQNPYQQQRPKCPNPLCGKFHFPPCNKKYA